MLVNFPLDLISNRIGLREFRPSDLEAVLSYRSDLQVKQFDTFGVNSESEVKAILAKAGAWASETPRTRYFGAVYDRNTTHLIGECALYLNSAGMSGEVGMMLHPVQWGRGLAGEALNLLQDLAIALELGSLTAQCHCNNNQAKKMLTKFGMSVERQTGETVVWSKTLRPDL